MSGPSTRSHRSSVRGTETTLTEVSALLKANKSVVMITGAGLSAASGIPTFRGGSDSVWSVTAASLGRRSVFLRDPLRWYNEFFLRHFPMSFTHKTPNAGHEAIAALARAFPELRVITQNIDGLHRDTVNVWPDPQRLIEAHGRLGLFKCVSDNNRDDEEDEEGEGRDECPYSFEKEIRPSAFSESVCATLEDDGCAAAARGLSRSLTEVPSCPHCGEAAPPMSLLFDEDYDSHSFYDFERVEEWFKEADALVFVGTSFAVTLTSLAIREAKRRKIPVFDFNLSVGLKASPTLNTKTVIGPAETTLPTLATLAGVTLATSPSPTATAAAEGAAATTSEAAAAAAAATTENPNHNHIAIHRCNKGSYRASGGGGGGGDDSNCSNISSGSRSVNCNSSTSSNSSINSSGCTSSGRNDSNVSSSSCNSSRSSISSIGSSSSNGSGGGNSSGSVSNSASSISTTTTTSGIASTDGNDEERTRHGPPAGRRTREDSPGTGGDEARPLEESRPIKKARTSNSGVDRADAAAGSATAVAAAAAASRHWGGGAPFLLDPALETPLRKNQVRVELSEAYSRKPHPDREVEANVETLWQEQLAKNPLLFNGSKFRLAGFSTEGGRATSPAAAPAPASDAMDLSEGRVGEGGGGGRGDAAATTTTTSPSPPLAPPQSRSPSSPPTRKLNLRLGLTDYKTFRGTNWSPAAARLAADSARDHPWLEGAYLSQKLGVGAVVETSDGYVVSLRRSNGVAEGQGMMDAPGGHPEPEKLGLTPETLRGLSRKGKSTRRKVAQQATDELFNSAVQEVVDETNLPRSALGKPLLSGLVRQGNSFGAPSAAFIIPCSLNRANVSALYAHGAKEAFESTELRLIPGAEIVAEGGAAWFAARGLQASPSFLGALELWRAHRFRSSS